MYKGVDYDDDGGGGGGDDESTIVIFLYAVRQMYVCCCCCETEWTKDRLRRPYVSWTMVFCSLWMSQAVNVASMFVQRLTAPAQAL